MSADPFENTNTVKNILQHMISPKIISDGAAGYIVRTDLVQVHNIIFANGTATEDGSSEHPFTTQCGSATTISGSSAVTIYHSRVTLNSIIMASITSGSGSYSVSKVVGNSTPGSFTITLSGTVPINTKVGWFIAKF
jgi:hypothetical protein